jgi:hypothetical protein
MFAYASDGTGSLQAFLKCPKDWGARIRTGTEGSKDPSAAVTPLPRVLYGEDRTFISDATPAGARHM